MYVCMLWFTLRYLFSMPWLQQHMGSAFWSKRGSWKLVCRILAWSKNQWHMKLASGAYPVLCFSCVMHSCKWVLALCCAACDVQWAAVKDQQHWHERTFVPGTSVFTHSVDRPRVCCLSSFGGINQLGLYIYLQQGNILPNRQWKKSIIMKNLGNKTIFKWLFL